MKPNRPNAAILLFIVVWLVAGSILVTLDVSFGGHRTIPQRSWYLGSAIIAVFVIVLGIVFMMGRRWTPFVIGLLFIADAAVPWLTRDPHYPDAQTIFPVAAFVLPALGVIAAALMLVTPSIRTWFRQMQEYRTWSGAGSDAIREDTWVLH